jgi:(E)-4-hydroxy-3-methylbut-2-enyl-diphosphate synthase
VNTETRGITARNPTRAVRIGSITIGAGHPIAVQSMCATKTVDVEATAAQVNQLAAAGAAVVRIAVDNAREARSLPAIRERTRANLSVDLQENYRLAAEIAPWVDKIRYNPGHLYHHEPGKAWQDKVRLLVEVAVRHDIALRVGVNCGSVDPAAREKFADDDSIGPMLVSALDHCELLDRLGFTRYCVSLKDSDPGKVIAVNQRFAAVRPDVPLHLGVTEAGMPPAGIVKSRAALGELLRQGIGDTLRISLTVPNARKVEEVEAGRQLVDDVASGRFRGDAEVNLPRLNIVSCPSCSRVENEAFVDLAEQVHQMTRPWADYPITIAVMGCRVNGPGETDDADLGLWCGPNFVNLKRGNKTLGAFRYTEILARLQEELEALIREKGMTRPE